MNRRALLIVAGAMVMRRAEADVPVIDIASIGQAIKEIEWLRDQYQVMTQNLQALTNGLNVGGIVPGLQTAGMQNPLGGIMGQIPNIVGGSVLGNGAQQFLDRDRLYQPAGNDFMATSMNGSSTGLANLKALAMQLMNTNGQRIGMLTGLINELTGASDVSQVSRVNGRIGVENQTLATQAAQFQQLQQMAALEQQTQQQRVMQKMRLDDDQQIEDTQPGNGTNPIAPQAVQAQTFVAGG